MENATTMERHLTMNRAECNAEYNRAYNEAMAECAIQSDKAVNKYRERLTAIEAERDATISKAAQRFANYIGKAE
jgi:hypothetical protein